MASVPPTATCGVQPSKSCRAGSSPWPPSMKRNASGVVQVDATNGDRPTTATTECSRSASWMAVRKNGSVSIFPVRASTTSRSWCSQPAWFSSEPRWWSTANSTVLARSATSPSHTVERPQYEPTSSMGSPGTGVGRRQCGRPQRVALVGGHEALGGQCDLAASAGAGRSTRDASPGVPVDDRVGIGAHGRLEVGADRVRQRGEARLLHGGRTGCRRCRRWPAPA